MVNPVAEGRRRLLPVSRESRIMSVATLVASIAFGAYTTGSVLWFTRYVGLPATQVGVGLSLAGLIWLPLSVFVGRLADRIGARRATVLTGLVQAVLLLVATQVRTLPEFYALAVPLAASEQGAWVCREALVADIAEREERVGAAAVVRTVFNVGVTLGSLLGGLALARDTRGAAAALLVTSAVLTVLATAGYALLPEKRQTLEEADPVRVRQALRDRPYLALAFLCGVLSMGDTVLVVGVPLWITMRTALPHGLSAWLFGINSLLVVALQIRISQGAESSAGAKRFLVRSGVVLALACACIAATAIRLPVLDYGCLVLAVLALTFGELWSSASSWNFRYSLAPEEGQGVYGGLFALGSSVYLALGPALVTALTLHFAGAGWLLLGGVFVLAAVAAGPAVGWAVRRGAGTAETVLTAAAASEVSL